MELLKNIFDSDVMEKTINSVIKVNDTRDVVTEIQEYIVTNEIEEHYKRFFDAFFNNSAPDTCVWISGFFGSGKSHFMKVLGYLLQNKNYQGIDVVKIIANKIKNNALLAADLKNKLTKQNNKVILFSMTDISSHDRSLLESIYSQIMVGFGYSESIELATYELALTLEGKYEEFKKMVLEEEGEEWEKFRDLKLNKRNRALSNIIPRLYQEVYNDKFKLSDVFMNISITADKIAELIKTMLELHPEYDNIILMIDEMGQYIGNDEEKMLYLQGISESIDKVRKEMGRKGIWLIVTSQQKLQDIIEDFDADSKRKFNRLSHRFSTRIDLRSEDIDRVIKDRVLRKKQNYANKLIEYYNNNGGAIASSLKIENSRNLYIGSQETFVESYPFLNYHFYIARDLLQEMMGPDKKHVNYGERNMIRLTQNVLKNSMIEMPFGSFASLDFIFDAVKQDIENETRLDIERKIPEVFEGYKNQELYVRVAKALFVLGHVKYIGNNIKNITACLTNNPLSPVSENDVKIVLNELIEKGFVGKTNEGGYKLLSVKEKKIEEKIKDAEVRKADIDRKRREIIEDLLKEIKAGIKHIGSKFEVNLTIDGEEKSKGGFISIEIHTSNKGQMLLDINNEKIAKWYTTEQTDINNMITRMLKLSKAINELEDDSHEAITIKREKQIELDGLKRDIPNKIEDSLMEGKIYYCGFDYKPKDYGNLVKNAAEKFVIDEIIPQVFNKFEDGAINIQPADYKKYIQDVILVDRPKGSYPDLRDLGIMEDKTIKLSGAVYDTLYNYILSKDRWKEIVLGSTIIADFAKPPYGWSQNVLRLVLAAMLRLGKIEIHSEGVRYDNYSQSKVKDIFLKDSLFKDVKIIPVIEADATARLNAKNRLATIFGKYAIDTIEDLAKKIKEVCEEEINKINIIKNQVKHIEFPETIIKTLTEKAKTYEKVNLSGDNQRITEFVKISEDDLQKTFAMVKSISEFIDEKIDEYKEVKEEINLIKRFNAYLSSDARLEFENKINDISSKINGESIINDWRNIYEQYLKLRSTVSSLYISIHNECNNGYEKAIKDMTERYRNDISKEKLEEFLRPLSNKMCHYIDKFENYRCNECKRDIQALKDDVDILETLKSGIVAKINNYLNPPKPSILSPKSSKENEIKIDEVIYNTQKRVIKNETDMEEFLVEVKQKIQKQLREGKQILIK